MKREDLKAMGLPDEQINTIMDLHGADIERQKTTVSTLTAERDGLKERLEEANGKLEGYDPEWKTKARPSPIGSRPENCRHSARVCAKRA